MRSIFDNPINPVNAHPNFAFTRTVESIGGGYTVPMVTVTHPASGRMMRCVIITPTETNTPDGFVPLKDAASFFEMDPRNIRASVKGYLRVDALPDDAEISGGEASWGDNQPVVSGNRLCQLVKLTAPNGKKHVQTCYSVAVINKVTDPFRFNTNKRPFLYEYHSFWDNVIAKLLATGDVAIQRDRYSNGHFNVSTEDLSPEEMLENREARCSLFLEFGKFIRSIVYGGRLATREEKLLVDKKIAECVDMINLCMFGGRARDIVYERLSLDKPFFGCTTFKGSGVPTLADLKNSQMFLRPDEIPHSTRLVDLITQYVLARETKHPGFETLREARRKMMKDNSLDADTRVDLTNINNWPEYVATVLVCEFNLLYGNSDQDLVRWGLRHWKSEHSKFIFSVEQARDLWLTKNCGGKEGFAFLRKYIKANNPMMTLREAMAQTNFNPVA